MTNFNALVTLNTDTANTIASSETNFDATAADFVLRNIVVAMDRILPEQFKRLPDQVIQTVWEAADVANQLAPLQPADKLHRTHETNEEFVYRLGVRHPLHSLQSRLNVGDFDRNNSNDVIQLKKAVKLGGLAFAAVVEKTADLPEIINTESYFWGNTTAAANRIARLERG
ncbi:MAG: hypothetical protein ABI602_02355 [Candidatus Saccharibacteria bacterium]